MPSPASAVRSLASRIEPRSVTVHGRYPCRLLDTTFVSARYGSPLGAPPHRASEPPPYEVSEGQQQQHRADRAKAGYQIVDGGHEVVRRVADGRGEAPVVGCRRGRRRAGLEDVDGHGAERGVVVVVLDLPLQLLDLLRDLAQLILDRVDVVARLRPLQERGHRVPLSLRVAESGLQVDVL